MENHFRNVFDKFMDFCSESLKGENPKFLDLIQIKYEACNEAFRNSEKMVILLRRTQQKMRLEESRKFVHLKDLITELKAWSFTTKKRKRKENKRKERASSDTDEEYQACKIPKLKECSVVLEAIEFPTVDDGITDSCSSSFEVYMDSAKDYSCAISDGNLDGAVDIIPVTENEQRERIKEVFSSREDDWCFNSSVSDTMKSSTLSSDIQTDPVSMPFSVQASHENHHINDHNSSSSSGSGKSPRKSVKIMDMNEIAKEGQILVGAFGKLESQNVTISKRNLFRSASKSDFSDFKSCTETGKFSVSNVNSQSQLLKNFTTIDDLDQLSEMSIIEPSLVNCSNQSADIKIEQSQPSSHRKNTHEEAAGVSRIFDESETFDELGGRCSSERPDNLQDSEGNCDTRCSDRNDNEIHSVNTNLESSACLKEVAKAALQKDLVPKINAAPTEMNQIFSPDTPAELENEDNGALQKELVPEISAVPTEMNQISSPDTPAELENEEDLEPELSVAPNEMNQISSPDTPVELENENNGASQRDLVLEISVTPTDTSAELENEDNGASLKPTESNSDQQLALDIAEICAKLNSQHEATFGEMPSKSKDFLPCLSLECKESKKPRRVQLCPVTDGDSQDVESREFNHSVNGQRASTWSRKMGPAPEQGDSADEFQPGRKHGGSGEEKGEEKKAPNQRHVRKLERLLESLRDEIEKCQNKEMSLSDLDAEDSAYVYEDKLKRKFVAAWNKLCEITKRVPTTGRPTEKNIKFSSTRYKEINRRLQKFLNKTRVFPDFHDVKSIVKLTSKKCKLNMSSMMIDDVAREAFVDIGEMLQTRRHQDFIATFGNRHTDALRTCVDPYMTDPELRKRLDSNRREAHSNLDAVIAKYSKLQYEGKDYENDDDEEEGENGKDTEKKIEGGDRIRKEETKEPMFARTRTIADIGADDSSDEIATADIEVDVAVEIADLEEGAAGSSQGASLKFSPGYKAFKTTLERNPYLHSTEKLLGFSSKLTRPDLQSMSSVDSVITIEESPVKMQESSSSVLKDQSFISKHNNKPDITLTLRMTDEESEADNRAKPNIKYTARKPLQLHVNSAYRTTQEKDIDSVGDEFNANSESQYVFQYSKSSIQKENDEDSEDESSDSSAGEDGGNDDFDDDDDAKKVDKDVDEMVMIIDQSDSDCESLSDSSRAVSPISVLSLSSDSNEEEDSYNENKEKKQTENAVATMKVKQENKGPTLKVQSNTWYDQEIRVFDETGRQLKPGHSTAHFHLGDEKSRYMKSLGITKKTCVGEMARQVSTDIGSSLRKSDGCPGTPDRKASQDSESDCIVIFDTPVKNCDGFDVDSNVITAKTEKAITRIDASEIDSFKRSDICQRIPEKKVGQDLEGDCIIIVDTPVKDFVVSIHMSADKSGIDSYDVDAKTDKTKPDSDDIDTCVHSENDKPQKSGLMNGEAVKQLGVQAKCGQESSILKLSLDARKSQIEPDAGTFHSCLGNTATVETDGNTTNAKVKANSPSVNLDQCSGKENGSAADDGENKAASTGAADDGENKAASTGAANDGENKAASTGAADEGENKAASTGAAGSSSMTSAHNQNSENYKVSSVDFGTEISGKNEELCQTDNSRPLLGAIGECTEANGLSVEAQCSDLSIGKPASKASQDTSVVEDSISGAQSSGLSTGRPDSDTCHDTSIIIADDSISGAQSSDFITGRPASSARQDTSVIINDSISDAQCSDFSTSKSASNASQQTSVITDDDSISGTPCSNFSTGRPVFNASPQTSVIVDDSISRAQCSNFSTGRPTSKTSQDISVIIVDDSSLDSVSHDGENSDRRAAVLLQEDHSAETTHHSEQDQDLVTHNQKKSAIDSRCTDTISSDNESKALTYVFGGQADIKMLLENEETGLTRNCRTTESTDHSPAENNTATRAAENDTVDVEKLNTPVVEDSPVSVDMLNSETIEIDCADADVETGTRSKKQNMTEKSGEGCADLNQDGISRREVNQQCLSPHGNGEVTADDLETSNMLHEKLLTQNEAMDNDLQTDGLHEKPLNQSEATEGGAETDMLPGSLTGNAIEPKDKPADHPETDVHTSSAQLNVNPRGKTSGRFETESGEENKGANTHLTSDNEHEAGNHTCMVEDKDEAFDNKTVMRNSPENLMGMSELSDNPGQNAEASDTKPDKSTSAVSVSERDQIDLLSQKPLNVNVNKSNKNDSQENDAHASRDHSAEEGKVLACNSADSSLVIRAETQPSLEKDQTRDNRQRYEIKGSSNNGQEEEDLFASINSICRTILQEAAQQNISEDKTVHQTIVRDIEDKPAIVQVKKNEHTVTKAAGLYSEASRVKEDSDSKTQENPPQMKIAGQVKNQSPVTSESVTDTKDNGVGQYDNISGSQRIVEGTKEGSMELIIEDVRSENCETRQTEESESQQVKRVEVSSPAEDEDKYEGSASSDKGNIDKVKETFKEDEDERSVAVGRGCLDSMKERTNEVDDEISVAADRGEIDIVCVKAKQWTTKPRETETTEQGEVQETMSKGSHTVTGSSSININQTVGSVHSHSGNDIVESEHHETAPEKHEEGNEMRISDVKETYNCDDDDDDDDVKIIQELSSTSSTVHSERTKEDDRNLVDEFIQNMALEVLKIGPRLCSEEPEKNYTPRKCKSIEQQNEPCMSEHNKQHSTLSCSDEHASSEIKKDTGMDESISAESSTGKKDHLSAQDQLFPTLEMECEEVNTSSEQDHVLTASTITPKACSYDDSSTKSGTQSRKRFYEDLVLEDEITESSLPKQQRCNEPDFITEIINSVLKDNPPSKKANKPIDDDDDDDDDVLFVKSVPNERTTVPPVNSKHLGHINRNTVSKTMAGTSGTGLRPNLAVANSKTAFIGMNLFKQSPTQRNLHAQPHHPNSSITSQQASSSSSRHRTASFNLRKITGTLRFPPQAMSNTSGIHKPVQVSTSLCVIPEWKTEISTVNHSPVNKNYKPIGTSLLPGNTSLTPQPKISLFNKSPHGNCFNPSSPGNRIRSALPSDKRGLLNSPVQVLTQRQGGGSNSRKPSQLTPSYHLHRGATSQQFSATISRGMTMKAKDHHEIEIVLDDSDNEEEPAGGTTFSPTQSQEYILPKIVSVASLSGSLSVKNFTEKSRDNSPIKQDDGVSKTGKKSGEVIVLSDSD